MSLTADQAREALLLEWEARKRRRLREEGPKFDWYGPPCGCPETRDDGSCPVHPRARANQRPPERGGVFVNYPDGDPPQDWENWLILAGRGFGKTRSVCEWLNDMARNGPKNGRYALVGAIAGEVRDVIIEGESGVLNISPPWFRPQYFPSKKRLVWPNGAMAFTYSSEEPGQFRGPQFHGALCDEAAKWENPDECYDNLQFGMRLGRNEGWTPRAAWSTTPLPIGLIKMLLNDPKTVVSRGSTFENAMNLAKSTVERFRRKYEGTRLGRQELYAEVLEDVPGALWKADLIERDRKTQHPDLVRVVVGVDPSGSSGPRKASAYDEEKQTEAGIVVAGRCEDDHYWVLEDSSVAGTPDEWARAAVAAYHRWDCDRLAAETNFGGDMVEATIRNVDEDVAFKKLWASRGKVPRAEPVAALFEQGRVHMVGVFEKLESQMCLAGDTPVATEHGEVRIDRIRPGMRVWTRDGLRQVAWSGLTFPNANVFEILTSDGRKLVATSGHPIYTVGSGFLPVSALEIGDELEVLPCELVSSRRRGSGSTGFRLSWMGVDGLPRMTGTTGTPGAVNCFIATSGRSITARSLMDTTSITRTKTGLISTSGILRPCLLPSTNGSILNSFPIPSTRSGASGVSGRSRSENLEISHAAVVVSHSLRRASGPSSVRGSVAGRSTTRERNASPRSLAGRIRSKFAPDVARDSSPRRTGISIAAGNVPSVSIVGLRSLPRRVPVYNLTVEGTPEFYSSGVLVHNCSYVPGMKSPDRMDALVWAITELQDSAPGSWGAGPVPSGWRG